MIRAQAAPALLAYPVPTTEVQVSRGILQPLRTAFDFGSRDQGRAPFE